MHVIMFPPHMHECIVHDVWMGAHSHMYTCHGRIHSPKEMDAYICICMTLSRTCMYDVSIILLHARAYFKAKMHVWMTYVRARVHK